MDISQMSIADLATMTHDQLNGIGLKDIVRFFNKHKEKCLGVIYSYTSKTTGKKYVGQTRDPYSRDFAHRACTKIGSTRNERNSVFSTALREDGYDNFSYNTLSICYAPDKAALRKTLDLEERKHTALFDTTNPERGYNKNPGGIALPLGGFSVWARRVKQYSLSGEFIASYDCCTDAGKAVGLSSGDITAACSPKWSRKSAGGFLWTYYEDDLDPNLIQYVKDLSLRGIVHRYTIDGEYIDSFQSLTDAKKAVNGDLARISYCAEPPNIHVAYGYRWSRERLKRLETNAASVSTEVHKYDKKGFYVASYDSIRAAAYSINIKSPTHIIHCLKDQWRKAGGYYWRKTKTERIDVIANPNRIKCATQQAVHCYSISGLYIDSFENCVDAADSVNGEASSIAGVSKPPYNRSIFGYRWSREKVPKLQSPPAKMDIAVHQYDKNGRYVTSYQSIGDGARSNATNRSHLNICLKDHWRMAGGYYWRTFKTKKIEILQGNRRCYGK